MHFLYSLALAAALLGSTPWWLFAMLRHRKYRAGIRERLGRVPERLVHRQPLHPPGPQPAPAAYTVGTGSIWVHAVSVGEVLAVTRLIGELKRRFPNSAVFVSTTTATGQKLARDRFGEENVFYFPLDFAFAIRPYLNALRPQLIVLVETEFWPNFMRLAKACGARVAVVNARISDRSFPRYSKFRGLMRRVLSNVDIFLAQSDEDQRRLIAIGANGQRVRVSGNLKFDFGPPSEPPVVAQLRAALPGEAPVIVSGSTVDGEEPIVLQAFEQVLAKWPEAVLILAPRHPERFAAVAELVSGSGLKFWRRSQWNGSAIAGGVFLLDSIGELGAIYALARISFVGGSLAPRGGHNILEPALFGVPVLVGPYTNNFRDIVELFARRNAVRVVHDGDELSSTLLQLLADKEAGIAFGERGAALVRDHSGATARTADALQTLCSNRQPPIEPNLPKPEQMRPPQELTKR